MFCPSGLADEGALEFPVAGLLREWASLVVLPVIISECEDVARNIRHDVVSHEPLSQLRKQNRMRH